MLPKIQWGIRYMATLSAFGIAIDLGLDATFDLGWYDTATVVIASISNLLTIFYG